LEVTPYRYALIELAKAVGGVFALRVHDKTDTSSVTNVASASEEEEDPVVDRVTTDDLVKLFGFSQPLQPKYFEVESFTGVMQVPGRHIYQQPGGGQPSVPGSVRPGGLRTPGGAPSGVPGGLPGGVRPGGVPGGLPGGGLPSGRVASAGGNGAALSASLGASSTSTGWQRISFTPGVAGGRGVAGMAGMNRGFGGLNGGLLAANRAGGGLGTPPGLAGLRGAGGCGPRG
jgi:hypothetical protein